MRKHQFQMLLYNYTIVRLYFIVICWCSFSSLFVSRAMSRLFCNETAEKLESVNIIGTQHGFSYQLLFIIHYRPCRVTLE